MTEKDWPLVAPNDNGIRPAGKPNVCFYCNQYVGHPHLRTCVIVEKLVRLRYIFEVDIRIPYAWGQNDIEFHRNQSTWCANNAIEELEAITDPCLCNRFTCEFVQVVDDTPVRELSDERTNAADKTKS